MKLLFVVRAIFLHWTYSNHGKLGNIDQPDLLVRHVSVGSFISVHTKADNTLLPWSMFVLVIKNPV